MILLDPKGLPFIERMIVSLECDGINISDYVPKKKIILYGAGVIGRCLYGKLKKTHSITCFIDKKHAGSFYDEIPIIALSELRIERGDESQYLIIVASIDYFSEINNELINRAIGIEIMPAIRIFAEASAESVYKDSNEQTTVFIRELFKNGIDKNKKIYLVTTVYTLFLCLLMEKDFRESVFIVYERALAPIFKRLNDMGAIIIDFTRDYTTGKKYEDRSAYEALVRFLAICSKQSGCQIYGQDNFWISRFFFDQGINVVEDGNENYNPVTMDKFTVRVRKTIDEIDSTNGVRDEDLNHYYPYGYDYLVKNVYLTRKNSIPQKLEKKARIIDVMSLWNNLSQDYRSQILSVFGVDKAVFDSYLKEPDKMVFLSSGFSAHSFMSINEEIALYKKILSLYDANKVIVKPHPCDDIDFGKEFPEMEILPNEFPIELIMLLGYKISKIIAVGSSALYTGLFNCDIDNYDRTGCLTGIEKKEVLPTTVTKFYDSNYRTKGKKKIAFVIRNHLARYGGISVSALITVRTLIKKGYVVDVFVTEDGKLKEDFIALGCSIVVDENLSKGDFEHAFWIEDYDLIIFSTIRFVPFLKKVVGKTPVLWWVHETAEAISAQESELFSKIDDSNNNLHVYGVSELVNSALNKINPNLKYGLLPIGIEDKGITKSWERNDAIRFATIGAIYPIKGQDVLLNAIKESGTDKRTDCEFLVIGDTLDEVFGRKIFEASKTLGNVHLYRAMTNNEILNLYQNVDVVIVPSRAESFSIVAAEAMMHGIVVLISDNTGVGKYICNKENGLIFSSGSSKGLANQIEWIMSNKHLLPEIGMRGRKLFKECLSENVFESNLLNIVDRLTNG